MMDKRSLTVYTNVLKTGPDRPVRPSTGHHSGPVRPFGPQRGWAGIEPDEPTIRPPNRTNRPVPFEPSGSNFFFPPSIRAAAPIVAGHWSVVPLAAAPTRWKALPQNAAKPRRRPLNPPSPAVVPIIADSVWNIEKFWGYF